MIYESINLLVLEKVPSQVREILDVGCGSGSLGKKIKQSRDCRITGITFSQSEADLAATSLDEVIVQDLNEYDSSSLGKFDCVICSHVLEHLCHPEKILRDLHSNMERNSVIIVALPNVLYWKQRLKFLSGKFKYTEGGLMDETHYRFFDHASAVQLIRKSGYEIVSKVADGNLPLPVVRKIFPELCRRLDKIALRLLPGLFGWQTVIVARLK